MKYDIHIYFYDMSCPRAMEIGCERLKNSHVESTRILDEEHRKVRVIICGDEASLCHVVEGCEQMDADIENYPIGMIPSGVTNDLSAVLGIASEMQAGEKKSPKSLSDKT